MKPKAIQSIERFDVKGRGRIHTVPAQRLRLRQIILLDRLSYKITGMECSDRPGHPIGLLGHFLKVKE